MPINQYHQPIGDALPGYTPGARPAITTLHGRYCRLEKLDPARHDDDASSKSAGSAMATPSNDPALPPKRNTC